MDDMTTPETEVIEQEVPETEVTEEVETEVEGEETANESAADEDDGEEVEFEGKQYKLPKELKEALLRQADYTRKTQEVAEQRRQIESFKAQVEQETQLQRQTLKDHAHLMTIDQQLEQFEGLNWDQVIEQDPIQAMKLQQQYSSLKGMREQVATRINQIQQQQFQMKQAELAKRMESGVAELKRDIANWSPELASSIKSYGVEKGGFSAQEIEQIIDPRQVKILHKAFLYDQLLSKQQATKPKPEPQKPVTTVKAKSTTTTKDPDKMSADEWLKWRESQLRKTK